MMTLEYDGKEIAVEPWRADAQTLVHAQLVLSMRPSCARGPVRLTGTLYADVRDGRVEVYHVVS